MGLGSLARKIERAKLGRKPTLYLASAVLLLILILVPIQQTAASFTIITVNTNNDLDDGTCDAAHCSLREAINTANNLAGPDTIQVAIGAGSIIKLTPNNQLPVITDRLGILGNDITVSGNGPSNISRVFEIGVGTAVTITRMTIREGNTFDLGGGITNLGDLTLIETTLTGNKADGFNGLGGAIYNGSGRLHLLRTTISNNQSGFYSGSIWNETGVLIIDNSTISGNNSLDGPGGIWAAGGTVMINQSTLADNYSFLGNDDLYNYGTLYMSNSILATGCQNYGPLALNVNTIIWNGECDGEYSSDIRIGPLGDYGGPTQTHPLYEGSPAIDGADPIYCPSIDQRGVPRPHDGHPCDIGSYEGFFSPTAVSLTDFGKPDNNRHWLWVAGLTAVLFAALARFTVRSKQDSIPVHFGQR